MFSRPGPIRRTVAFCPLTIHCLSLRFPRLYKSVIERLSPFPKHWNIFCSSKTPLLPLKYGGVYRLLAYKRKSSRFTSHSLLQLLSSTLRYFVIDNFWNSSIISTICRLTAMSQPRMSFSTKFLDVLRSMQLEPVKILDEKEATLTQVIETSTMSSPSVRKVIKRYHSLIDERGDYRSDISVIEREINIMKRCKHPHLMPAEKVRHSRTDNSILVCMPMCPNGDLAKLVVSGLSPYRVNLYLIQTACALRYLHNQRIIHGDVKPDNIFLDASNNAVLADFGGSSVLPLGNDSVTSWHGTLGFLGPEYGCSEEPLDAFKVSGFVISMLTYII